MAAAVSRATGEPAPLTTVQIILWAVVRSVKVKEIKLSAPKGSGVYETKALLDCALWELDIVDQDYAAGWTPCSSTRDSSGL